MTTAAAATTRVSERRGDRAQRPQAAQPAEPQRREPHGDVLRLQRMAGNRAVTHLLASGRPSLQRKCASCASGGATCEHCAEEDKRLQRKAAGGQPRGRLSHVHQLLRTPGEVLNPAVATSMGDRFGADFSSVRVHRDSGAAESARRVDALAYTVGGHIVFGRGQYDPDSGPGQRLIAHELTHVLQQGGGGLPPRGLAVDDNPAREAEADRAASSATDGARHPAASTQRTAPSVVARQATNPTSSSAASGSVESVEISCGANAITFRTAAGVHEYALTACDVTDGEYIAGVTVTGHDVSFDLGQQAAEGRRFFFTYDVAPGQPNPATLFRNQHTVRVVAHAGMPGGEGAVNFSVQILTAEGFRALTGADPDRLTEGRYVSGASLQPGASVTGAPERTWLDPATTASLVPSLTTPLPHVIPRNATGVMWTQVGHGHFSQFASVEGSLTARGFRGSLVRQGWGMLFPQTLQTGIPGGFRNDFLFTFSPGQTVVYRPVDPTAAESFRSRLNVTEFPETYRLPPRPGLAAACQGANCITVPAEVIKEALGGRPEILTPEGPVDITKMGRPTEGAPFESSQAGRGATVREYLGQPDEYFTERGLTRTRVPAYTPYARTGVGFVKAGGVIFMVYGAYRTYERLEAAAGTPEFPAVVTEEAGSWTGGILGSAFGAAAGAAIACSPTGPVTLVCVAGGFIGGLIFGYLGGAAGAEVGRGLYAGGGGECPSCHAEQRKWEQERRFKNIPEFGRSSLLPRGSLGSGQLTEEESRLIREWLAAPRPTQ